MIHVFNNSPLALCVCVFVRVSFVYGLVLVCRRTCVPVSVWKWNVRPCVATCWKWPLMGRESEPSMLLFHVAPTGTGRAPAGLLSVIPHPEVH